MRFEMCKLVLENKRFIALHKVQIENLQASLAPNKIN